MQANRQFIEIGGKKLRMVGGQEEIVSSRNWRLHKLPVSACGRFQNYRLYLDVSKARKNVWFLNTYANSNKLVRNREVEILDKYYPGMLAWFEDAIAGKKREAPVDRDNGVAPPKKSEPLTAEMIEEVLCIVEEAWDQEFPLSIYAQTEATGRYAGTVVAQALGVSKHRAKAMLQTLVDAKAIQTVMFDSNLKMRGLRSTRSLEEEQRQTEGWRQQGATGAANNG